MKPVGAILLGIVLGIVGIYLYSNRNKTNIFANMPPSPAPGTPPGPAPGPIVERTSNACNCQMIITTPSGSRTLHGTLRNGTCDVTSGCIGGY